MANIKDFAEQLVNLTVKEVKELADILKEEYGIEPAAAPVAVAAVAGGAEGGAPGAGSRYPAAGGRYGPGGDGGRQRYRRHPAGCPRRGGMAQPGDRRVLHRGGGWLQLRR